jgi:hypothetical protein
MGASLVSRFTAVKRESEESSWNAGKTMRRGGGEMRK